MRLLIISPHFPPVNAADMQRVRLVLPYLLDHMVAAEVLCVCASQVASPQDEWLAEGLNQEVKVHRVRALGLTWGRVPGYGTLTFRALGALRHYGDALLSRSSFDLIYFSTTQFGLHVLGPEWKRKFGVPFVMDYQDPWVSDYYREHPDVVPPGGRLKYAVSSWLSRRQEPRVLLHCSGITSVSAAYPRQLQARYPWLEVDEEKQKVGKQKTETTLFPGGGRKESGVVGIGCADLPPERVTSALWPSALEVGCSTFDVNHLKIASAEARHSAGASSTPAVDRHRLPSVVIPFPGDQRDLDRVEVAGTGQGVFDPNDGFTHWVYIGRGGADMAPAVRALFLALRQFLDAFPASSQYSFQLAPFQISPSFLRLHFIGTSYAAAGRGKKTIESLASEFDLEQMVVEHTDRIPYSQTLRCLLDADALVVPGSDDPGYTASKIYPYLLAEKPLLTVFHEQSSVVNLIREVGGAVVVTFSTGEPVAAVGERIRREWLENERYRNPVPLDMEAFEPYTARAQAGQLAAFFRKCLE
jgi:hypothetical protein